VHETPFCSIVVCTTLRSWSILVGQGAAIDTTTAAGKLVFGIFAALAEFEREFISERTVAGLASARREAAKAAGRSR